MKANQRSPRTSPSGPGPRPKSRRQQGGPARLWLEIANQTLIETHRTPEFLEAQQQLLAHGMDFLLAEREFVEALVEPAGLPTRTEIDEVHHTVQDLKRRVRALEKGRAATLSPEPRRLERPTAGRSARKAPAQQGVNA